MDAGVAIGMGDMRPVLASGVIRNESNEVSPPLAPPPRAPLPLPPATIPFEIRPAARLVTENALPCVTGR